VIVVGRGKERAKDDSGKRCLTHRSTATGQTGGVVGRRGDLAAEPLGLEEADPEPGQNLGEPRDATRALGGRAGGGRTGSPWTIM